jgi:multisubunit Na+/H+ antiporter MnhF subunit
MSLLDIVILLLILSWAGGFSLHVAGSTIHLLLVIAVVVLVYRVITGRRIE